MYWLQTFLMQTSKGDGYFVSKNSPIYYPEDNSAVDFIAYYPYSETISDYKNYPIDLSNQTKQNAIDLMTAVNLTNRQLASPQGNLQFKHLLAKLVLNFEIYFREFPERNQSFYQRTASKRNS